MSDVREAWSMQIAKQSSHPFVTVTFDVGDYATIETYLNGPGAPERVALLEAVARATTEAGETSDPIAYDDARAAAYEGMAALAAYDREHGIGGTNE